MNGILDRVTEQAARHVPGTFQAGSAEDLFALSLARRLNEPQLAAHYAELLERYGEEQLLVAYKRVRRSGNHRDMGRAFHEELRRIDHPVAAGGSLRRLAAIRIDRRTIAVALFKGQHLEHPPMLRHLPTDSEKAVASAIAFISRVFELCPFERAALESLREKQKQRAALSGRIQDILAREAVSFWHVPTDDLLSGFGHPRLSSRQELRRLAAHIWTDTGGGYGSPFVRDALALGLYCQTESLFDS